MLPSVPRALILALALIAPWPVVAAEYTPEDVVQAVEREFPEETIVLMIEGQEWHLDDEATMRLLRSGVPPKYVALMLGDDGLSVDELEAMAAARAPEIEGMSGSFCVVTTQDGEKFRGQILAATATSVVLVQVDDSVRVLPRETVVAATSARATLREWRSRVGKPTFVALANGEIVDGELVAAEEDVLVLRRSSGKYQTIAAEDVVGLVLSPPSDRRDAEKGGRAGPTPLTRDFPDPPRADMEDEDGDRVVSVNPGAPPPGEMVRRGQATATAGLILTSVSAGAYTLGRALGSEELYVAGSVGLVVGSPIIAGGSLRACNGLRRMGVDVSPVSGGLAWGFWGGALLVSVATTVDPAADPVTGAIVSDLMLLSSVVFGSVQAATNGSHIHDRSASIDDPRDTRPDVALYFSGQGLTIAGQF